MKIKNNKGFTLVELIIVIAILAIIMMIVVPNVPTIIQRQRVRADRASAQKVAEYVRAWYSDYTVSDRTKVTNFENAKITAGADTDTSNAGPSVDANAVGNAPLIYTKVDNTITTYIEDTFKPTSLLNDKEVQEAKQEFAVFLTPTSSGAKIGVAVVALDNSDNIVNARYTSYDGVLEVNYDGYRYDATKHSTSNNIIYIEGEE